MFKWMLSTTLLVLLMGCSTLKDSSLLGMGVGSVVGAGMGAVSGKADGKSNQKAVTGAAIGAALGGLLGFLDFNQRAKSGSLPTAGTKQTKKKDVPYLTKPKVERVWVPERVEGDKYISGHWMYVIDRPSIWSKD